MRMTTVELPDALVKRARIYAIQRRTTLRALIEQGLRDVLARKEEKP
jgi:predicted transcriptional regulator